MDAVKEKPTKYESSDYALGEMRQNDKRLLRQIDWQILPIMFMTYFLQFVDKVSLNVSYSPVLCPLSNSKQYANVMGLQDDLGMSGNDFPWLATAFFIAYAVAEVPQGEYLTFGTTSLSDCRRNTPPEIFSH